jgi:hypothetical protein
MPLPELIALTVESLDSAAAYMRVMSIGRDEQEMIALNRAAKRIDKLGASLGRLVNDQRELIAY